MRNLGEKVKVKACGGILRAVIVSIDQSGKILVRLAVNGRHVWIMRENWRNPNLRLRLRRAAHYARPA